MNPNGTDSLNKPCEILFPYSIPDVYEKLKHLESAVHRSLMASSADDLASWGASPPLEPARDIEVRRVRLHPPKKSLLLPVGQARLLHDLASIELQATELAVRSLVEFPEAPREFRQELAEIALGEGRHLKLCLEAMESLGSVWGDWPVHTALWSAVDASDDFLDRLLIVHRYLEGSGLDAGDSLRRRLRSAGSRELLSLLSVIFEEEVEHVAFGSRWYQSGCQAEGLDPAEDFPVRMRRLEQRLPRRFESLVRPLRRRAGFSEEEMNFLETWQQEWRGAPQASE